MTRYSFAPIDQLYPFRPTGGFDSEPRGLSARLGVANTNIYRHRKYGMAPEVADRMACRLGLHPSLLWPSWFDDAIDDLRDRERRVEWWKRIDKYREFVVILEEVA